MTFLSCMTSSVTAILFGIVAMIKDEVYWTEDYLLYAQYVVDETEKAKAQGTVREPETELLDEGLKENDNA